MYKNFTVLKYRQQSCIFSKIAHIMKLTGIILMTVILQVSASTYGQKITIQVKSAALQDILLDIQQQSGYDFLYSSDLLNRAKPITLAVKDASINEVIEKCMENQPFSYTIFKKTVTIRAKDGPKPDQQLPTMLPIAITVNGVVTDEKGLPLPGVNVLEKGTSNGVTTNVSGRYTLKVAGPNSSLVFSFMGYASQEIKVGTQTIIEVQLTELASDLNEVIVVGYGTQKKASLTGSVASIDGAEILKTRNENVLNMLTGKLPGLRVLQTDAEPGNFSSSFDIRGLGAPLVIIDGVPRGNIQRLDPNDIESISILKDAAAAVYGVQAANGVVLVTTRKGKSGVARIQYNFTTGFSYASGLPTPIGAIDWMNLKNEQSMHNIGNPANKTFNQAAFDAFTSGAQQSTDWYSVAIDKIAPQTQHNLNISGGTETSSYYVSLGYQKFGGFYKSGELNYNKYNFRSNVTAKIANNLTIDIQLSGIKDQKNQPYDQSQDLFKALWRAPPNLPVFANNNPAYVNNLGDNGVNSYATTRKQYDGFRDIKTNTFQGLFDVIYNIPFIKGLKAKALFSYDYQVNDNNIYQKTFNLYSVQNTTGIISFIPQAINATNGASLDSRQYQVFPNTLLQGSLDYNHVFNMVHNIQLLAVYEERTTRTDNFSASRTESIPTLNALSAGNAAGQTGTQSIDQNALVSTKSLVSRLHYDYKSKYLIDVLGRYDGSSRFSASKQWGFFPGVTAAWRISEEGFIKKSRALSFVDNIKIRASYGKLGDQGSLSYQFLGGYNYPLTVGDPTNNAPAGYVMDGNFVTALSPRTLPNLNLSWITTKTINLGLDIDLWKGLLSASLDAFSRERDGLFGTRAVSLPGQYGTGLPSENLNSDRAQGFELSLTHANRLGKLNYSINANITYTRNKLLHQEASPYVSSYDNWLNNKNNRWNDVVFGYGAAGRFTSFNDIYTYPTESQINNNGGNRAVLPGDYKYVDWNGDGYITTADKYPIVNTTGQPSIPLIYFGLTPSVGFMDFDLSATFQGAAMRSTAYPEALAQPLTFGGGALQQFLDRWHPVDPNANQFDPHTQYVSGTYAVTGSNYDTGSGFSYKNGAYVRMKTVELGYTLPKAFTKKIGIQRVRIYTNGYNILTLSYIKDVDPEKPSDQNGYRYPMNKTYNLGVNVTF
ncbi:TonB-dependent receptor [Mucilaginibacter sp.]|uniref:TonB-dependent receptor n=1 Tax=Mucilaginibacter sp. TaxID=1882438 RepID=UPI002607A019|nr:TonB-dependent receptor [Mucilaginibacter sp.]MDB4926403.1 TonB-linked outer membrane protein SusC/RagA family [Mucilaginibacter sp.]